MVVFCQVPTRLPGVGLLHKSRGLRKPLLWDPRVGTRSPYEIQCFDWILLFGTILDIKNYVNGIHLETSMDIPSIPCSPGCPVTHCILATNSQTSTCLCLPHSRIKGVHHRAQLRYGIFWAHSKSCLVKGGGTHGAPPILKTLQSLWSLGEWEHFFWRHGVRRRYGTGNSQKVGHEGHKIWNVKIWLNKILKNGV